MIRSHHGDPLRQYLATTSRDIAAAHRASLYARRVAGETTAEIALAEGRSAERINQQLRRHIRENELPRLPGQKRPRSERWP